MSIISFQSLREYDNETVDLLQFTGKYSNIISLKAESGSS